MHFISGLVLGEQAARSVVRGWCLCGPELVEVLAVRVVFLRGTALTNYYF